MGGPKASEISELRRMAKWRENPEEIKGEDELLTGEELKLFQSVAVQFHILAMDRVDLMSTVEESMRKMASPRARDLAALKRIARFTINNLRMAGRYPQTGLDRKYWSVCRCKLCWMNINKKSTGGGAALWSGRFAKGMVQNYRKSAPSQWRI